MTAQRYGIGIPDAQRLLPGYTTARCAGLPE